MHARDLQLKERAGSKPQESGRSHSASHLRFDMSLDRKIAPIPSQVNQASKRQDDRNDSCKEYVGISVVVPVMPTDSTHFCVHARFSVASAFSRAREASEGEKERAFFAGLRQDGEGCRRGWRLGERMWASVRGVGMPSRRPPCNVESVALRHGIL
jgi:hypothetical protein